MNKNQILKEIAYYSRVINERKQWIEVRNNNKYKYTKPPAAAAVMIPNKLEKAVATKVLINPNFNTTVHINPHYKNNNNNMIHVNPNVLKSMSSKTTTTTNSLLERKRRNSIRSKYKIVKSCVTPIRTNAYKIDRRCSVKGKQIVGISDFSRNQLFRSSRKCVQNHNKSTISKRRCTKHQRNNNNIMIRRNKLKKCNQPCPAYRHFGKCRRKELGRCLFVHNPNQIFVCKQFLQGACFNDNCLLSHKVSASKMPTCKYFLEGCCVKSDCPYLHVKISRKADICPQFLQGFCQDGERCNKRHQFLCPDFERKGECLKRRCLFPHVNSSSSNKHEKTQVKKKEEEEEQESAARYYVDDDNNDCQVSDLQQQQQQLYYYKRSTLGSLPSFIPF